MRAIFRVLFVWMTLLALPIHGFASATIPCCAPPAAAGLVHDHSFAAPAHDAHAGRGIQHDHRPAPHHHAGKCTTCGACGAGVPIAPAFAAVAPVSGSRSLAIPFDPHILASVDLAHPERPPRA